MHLHVQMYTHMHTHAHAHAHSHALAHADAAAYAHAHVRAHAHAHCTRPCTCAGHAYGSAAAQVLAAGAGRAARRIGVAARALRLHTRARTTAEHPRLGSRALSQAASVTVSGSHAFVASYYSDSLTVVDIGDPTSPSIVGFVSSSSQLDGVRGERAGRGA